MLTHPKQVRLAVDNELNELPQSAMLKVSSNFAEQFLFVKLQ